MLITKIDGTKEDFDVKKLKRSLKKAGASSEIITEIVEHIQGELKPGMTTSYIYRHARKILKQKMDSPVAARYSLRRAIMDLGPSGFPFERLLGEVFDRRGYETYVGVEMTGACDITHEVDVVAKREGELIVIEAKFHNQQSYKTNVRVPLYVHSRFEDLKKTNFDNHLEKGSEAQCWIMTNTKFTGHAKRYGKCVNLHLVGWNYPDEGNIQDLIEETGLHPLTCLTTLSKAEKKSLFDEGVVLCQNVKESPDLLSLVGVKGKKQEKVLQEAAKLCIPHTTK